MVLFTAVNLNCKRLKIEQVVALLVELELDLTQVKQGSNARKEIDDLVANQGSNQARFTQGRRTPITNSLRESRNHQRATIDEQ